MPDGLRARRDRTDVTKFTFVTALAALLAPPALAQPTEEAPICADRPGKGSATCTVPDGIWQLETSVADWSRLKDGGTRTDELMIGSPVVKLGLSDRSDLEIGIPPYAHVETKAGGSKSSVSGFGDLTVRYKHRLTTDGSKIEVSVIPFVKLPTANRNIGNGKVEGGLAMAVSLPVSSMSLSLSPELDAQADADGGGRHFQLANVVGLSGEVAPGLTLGGEMWTATNFDPADTFTQLSADASAAYLVNNDLQLDAGANFGLKGNTPGIEFYAGVSVRF